MNFRRRKLLTPLILLLGMTPLAGYAVNTDVVVFANGDRLTGEIKSLERGKLRFKTDATGTINIEWEDVAILSSEQKIQAETHNGTRYFGTLDASKEGRTFILATSRGPVVIDGDRLVKLTPIDQEGWRDWDVDISAGYNFTSANSVEQFNIGASASHRTRTRILGATFSSVISDAADADTSQRETLGFNLTRLRANRWLNTGNLDFTSNDELGINLRASLGSGIGRIMAQTNHSMFILEAGLKITNENLINVEDDTQSLESYGKLDWDWFRYDSPEWDLSTQLEIIPSITEWGRIRADINTKLKWEIIGDFFWMFEFYDSYDNRPQSPDAANNDYGVITSIVYDF